jgi:hypothetical protein
MFDPTIVQNDLNYQHGGSITYLNIGNQITSFLSQAK